MLECLGLAMCFERSLSEAQNTAVLVIVSVSLATSVFDLSFGFAKMIYDVFQFFVFISVISPRNTTVLVTFLKR